MNQNDPTKRIPKSLGTDAKLFGTYTLTDLAVALFPGVLVILFTQVVLSPSTAIAGYRLQTFTLPVAGGAIALGALFVYLTPTYTTSLDWFATFIGFHRGSKELTHEDAKQYTQIERVHPDRGAIERTDGALFGLVHVTPPTMALATDAEWATKARAFEDFCNTVVEFPIQLYSTTQPFPTDEYLAQYESRLTDPDVKENPKLAALIEHYTSWYAADLDERRMTIRDHYVVVSVTPAEVRFERESLTEKLAAVPLLGLFVRARLAPRIEAQREAMFDALDERLRRIEGGLRGIDGCRAYRVDAEEATQLICEFWAGEQRDYQDITRVLRTRPLVGGRK
ncbi:hypothetical protein [Haloprofundus halophilus]|uniref:hypothetical protein n=1 Tax=Haloprofundus halophilus TaxID=2283527 RepID=UPI000E441CB5|nr:hypothetical protein [Haloprofundus halophilus]